jgi:uncharacterized repeat protein (TIGR03803 family)
MTPNGTLTTLYNFCSQPNCADGAVPGQLVLANNGDLYGTTGNGGTNTCTLEFAPPGCGTVFKITSVGALTTLYNFCAQPNCADGMFPPGLAGGLVQASNGNFYGTTSAGGANAVGTVFKITPSGTLTTLYSLCSLANCADGEYAGGMVQASNGNLYGITYAGGTDGGGTVFKITPSGTLTTLYSFCSLANCTDGQNPEAGLVQTTNGSLYGTTLNGGAYGGGTIYKITPSGTFTTLYSFCSLANCADGQNLYSGLVQATDGDLYGTTHGGGAYGSGTIFAITANGTLTTIYSFCSLAFCDDGEFPIAGLVQATNGSLYGATDSGGANIFYGTIFSVSVGLGPFVESLPTVGKVGSAVKILGSNLTGATSVTFNGTAAVFTVHSPTLITTTVPPGATTGKIQVVTPGGTLSSNVPFRMRP